MSTLGITQKNPHALFVLPIEHMGTKSYKYGDNFHEESVHPRLGPRKHQIFVRLGLGPTILKLIFLDFYVCIITCLKLYASY